MLISRSAALRSKYRVSDTKTRLQPWLLGFHPKNRSGVPPNGDRCLNLTKSLVSYGFDPEEADTGGICCEPHPSRIDDYHIYNVKSCQGNPLLAPSVEGIRMQYGTLAHSHLNQILKNIDGGVDASAFAEKDATFKAAICANDGRLSKSVLAIKDKTFAEYCDKGLLWETLSYKIVVEEPNGCKDISNAINAKNKRNMTAHEMQCCMQLMKFCAAESAVAERVCFRKAKEDMANEMPEFSEDPDFIELFKFALEHFNHPAVNQLSLLHEKFVDPQANESVE